MKSNNLDSYTFINNFSISRKKFIKKTSTKTKDILLNRYNSPLNDEVWTLDFTNVKTNKKSYWIATLMDIATRQIILHYTKPGIASTFCTKDVINLIHEATLNRQRPKVIHTDQGGQFVAKDFSDFLKSAGIQQSIGDQLIIKFPNQAHEISNKTIKSFIRKEIRNQMQTPQVPKNFHYLNKIDETKAKWIINNAISAYNQHPHTHLFQAPPNLAEIVLAKAESEGVFAKEQSNRPNELIIYKSGTSKQIEVKQKLAEIFKKHALEWIKDREISDQKVQQTVDQFYGDVDFLMLALQVETLKKIQAVQEQADQNQKQILKQAQLQQEELQIRLIELQDKLEKQTADLEVLVQTQKRKDMEEREKAAKKVLRKNRKRLPARDAASAPELFTAWSVCEQSNADDFSISRNIVVLLILFLTGERISNILLFTANHLRQLLDPATIYIVIPRIKSVETRYRTVTFSQHAWSLISRCEKHIRTLLLGKQEDDFVITARGKTKTLGRTYLNKNINNILKIVGKRHHKKISTHSFRIGLTTSIIETSGIHAAQAFIGHADISTTNIYSRAELGIDKLRDVANKADLFRQERLKKRYKKRMQRKE